MVLIGEPQRRPGAPEANADEREYLECRPNWSRGAQADWAKREGASHRPVRLREGTNDVTIRLYSERRRGVLMTEWEQKHQSGRLIRVKSLQLVSLADRALAVQLLQLALCGEPATIRLEASFESTGSALDLLGLERDAALWRTAESGKTLAMAARARLRLDGAALTEERSQLKWVWSWRHEPGQVAEFVRLVAFAKGDVDFRRYELSRKQGHHASRGGRLVGSSRLA